MDATYDTSTPTKGPWFAVYYPYHWRIQDADGYEGRDLLGCDDDVGDRKNTVGDEKAAANARLMTAAPELLKACMGVLEFLPASGSAPKTCRAGAIDAANAVRAAIAKAIGVEVDELLVGPLCSEDE